MPDLTSAEIKERLSEKSAEVAEQSSGGVVEVAEQSSRGVAEVAEQSSRECVEVAGQSSLESVETAEQLSRACGVIKRHLRTELKAVHLFGSAVDGGLKPHSDIDLLVTVTTPPDLATRQALLLELLTVSAPPGKSQSMRPLEVTVISYNEVVPWRYPARRELQFGEWLRKDLLSGVFESAGPDIDLAILLTKARQCSIALIGPTADGLFDPVPQRDFLEALTDTLKLWNSPADWEGDERNVVLTVARIWYSISTGQIAPKDVAATWLLQRLPLKYQSLLIDARLAYVDPDQTKFHAHPEEITAFMLFAKSAIGTLLDQ